LSYHRNSALLKQRVAREAATLLYTLQEKEYKQAKQKAAQTLGARILPSNRDIANELDLLADELEGSARQERLVQMRREALGIMRLLRDFQPVLIGSVWRGTANRHSDIDIVTFSGHPTEVKTKLEQKSFAITKTEWQSAPKTGKGDRSFHIYINLQSGNEVEVVVRRPERVNRKVKDEIYGDILTGLNFQELENLLCENPTRKFTPKNKRG
jgi:predicted nucleotidyltransferase